MMDIGDTGGTDIYELTSLKDGTLFDLANTGHPQKIAWTKPGSNFAVLVLPVTANQMPNEARHLAGLFGRRVRAALVDNLDHAQARAAGREVAQDFLAFQPVDRRELPVVEGV